MLLDRLVFPIALSSMPARRNSVAVPKVKGAGRPKSAAKPVRPDPSLLDDFDEDAMMESLFAGERASPVEEELDEPEAEEAEEEEEGDWVPDTEEPDQPDTADQPDAKKRKVSKIAFKLCRICGKSSKAVVWFVFVVLLDDNGVECQSPQGPVCLECGTVAESFVMVGDIEEIMSKFHLDKSFQQVFKGALHMLQHGVSSNSQLRSWRPHDVVLRNERTFELKEEAAFVTDFVFCSHFKTDWRQMKDSSAVKSLQLEGLDGKSLDGVLMQLASAITATIPHFVVTITAKTVLALADTYLANTETLHGDHARQYFTKLGQELESSRPKSLTVKEFPKIDTYEDIKNAVNEHQDKLKAASVAAAAAIAAAAAGGLQFANTTISLLPAIAPIPAATHTPP